jgi:hypothetical protein
VCAEHAAAGVAMLHKFALTFKTKTIEFFAEEDEDEDADQLARSQAPGADGVIAWQRVVVLKPDPPNPSPAYQRRTDLCVF